MRTQNFSSKIQIGLFFFSVVAMFLFESRSYGEQNPTKPTETLNQHGTARGGLPKEETKNDLLRVVRNPDTAKKDDAFLIEVVSMIAPPFAKHDDEQFSTLSGKQFRRYLDALEENNDKNIKSLNRVIDAYNGTVPPKAIDATATKENYKDVFKQVMTAAARKDGGANIPLSDRRQILEDIALDIYRRDEESKGDILSIPRAR